LRATNYVGAAAVLRGSAVAAAGGVTIDCCRNGNYGLLLRVVDAVGNEGAGRVVHVPAVLLHRGDEAGEVGRGMGSDDRFAWELNAVRAHLARSRLDADVIETRPGCRRIRFHLPEKPPLVSIIVPTRDALPLLQQCIGSVREKTTYPRYEILVIDNQSADPQTLAYFRQIAAHFAVRVLRYDKPFNFSALNNFAAHEARGEVLCLLNNDTEVRSPDWLEEMVGHLLQPQVGVVGAKLYFADGRVQHAGDTVGPGGCANHLHAFIDPNDPGYCDRAAVAQELSAVTAACCVTWRELYLKMGGLDERRLAVAFNDVDYCLRMRKAGYRVVWTPHAELTHHESVSRGSDTSLRRRMRARLEVMTMRRRWGDVMWNDPFYNPNLSYQYPDFSLSRAPRVRKPGGTADAREPLERTPRIVRRRPCLAGPSIQNHTNYLIYNIFCRARILRLSVLIENERQPPLFFPSPSVPLPEGEGRLAPSLIPDPSPGGRRETLASPLPVGEGSGVRDGRVGVREKCHYVRHSKISHGCR
jgi:O-antigen biosynthesis protein